MRERKDAVEVGHRQEFCGTGFYPPGLGQGLALGTMAITARMIADDHARTLVTHGSLAAEGRRPTHLDRAHHPSLLACEGMRRAVRLAVGPNNIGQLGGSTCLTGVRMEAH